MWRWISWILETLSKLVSLLKDQRAEAEQRIAEQQQREDEATKKLEQEINKKVENVARPELDASEQSADPLGINRWNTGR